MKINILIPAYNEEKTIYQILYRLYFYICQYKKSKLIVVNDGSYDNTKQEINKIKKLDYQKVEEMGQSNVIRCEICQEIIEGIIKDKIRKKEHYLKYKEIYIKRANDFWRRNPEKVKEYKKNWNKKFWKESFKKYISNPDNKFKQNLNSRIWKLNNPVKQNLYRKKFRKKNPKILSAWNYAHKYKQKFDRCLICKKTDDLQFHHTSYEDNKGCTLCRECHQEQHNLIKLYGWGD